MPGEGQKASESKRAEDGDARGRKMQKQGGGESRYLGRRKQILGEAESGALGGQNRVERE